MIENISQVTLSGTNQDNPFDVGLFPDISERDIQDTLSFARSRTPLKTGAVMALIVERVSRDRVAQFGDTPAVRRSAKTTAYDFIRRQTGFSTDTIRVYIRCFEVFGRSPGDARFLSLSDMQLLCPHHTDKELVATVTNAKSDDPDMRREDVRKLIHEYLSRRSLPDE